MVLPLLRRLNGMTSDDSLSWFDDIVQSIIHLLNTRKKMDGVDPSQTTLFGYGADPLLWQDVGSIAALITRFEPRLAQVQVLILADEINHQMLQVKGELLLASRWVDMTFELELDVIIGVVRRC